MDMSRTLLLITLSVLEICFCHPEETSIVADVPLSKSLGFKINLNNTLEDEHIAKEYMYLYNEMLKASQESSERFNKGEDYITRFQGRTHPKRGAPRESLVGQRRSRSQALRREKLNSQSLRSHLEHSRRRAAGDSMMEQ